MLGGTAVHLYLHIWYLVHYGSVTCASRVLVTGRRPVLSRCFAGYCASHGASERATAARRARYRAPPPLYVLHIRDTVLTSWARVYHGTATTA